MKISSITTPVKKFVSSPRTAEFVENTYIALSVETLLKMTGRPAFIYMDKKADKESKKYASAKEFLYQAICLALYVSLIPPIKKLFFNGFSKMLNKNHGEALKAFKTGHKAVDNAKEAYIKEGSFVQRTLSLLKIKKNEKIINARKIFKDAERHFGELLKEKDSPLHFGKGVKEAGAIAASILMLTVLAPQISHYIIHPLMKALGFEKGHEQGNKAEVEKNK